MLKKQFNFSCVDTVFCTTWDHSINLVSPKGMVVGRRLCRIIRTLWIITLHTVQIISEHMRPKLKWMAKLMSLSSIFVLIVGILIVNIFLSVLVQIQLWHDWWEIVSKCSSQQILNTCVLINDSCIVQTYHEFVIWGHPQRLLNTLFADRLSFLMAYWHIYHVSLLVPSTNANH